MKLVVVESPYGSNPDGSRADALTVERNVRYARAAVADCLRRGEAPLASHLLYPQPGVLDDGDPEERKLGMEAGFAWGAAAELVVAYIDLGWTAGMKLGVERARARGAAVEVRWLPKQVLEELTGLS